MMVFNILYESHVIRHRLYRIDNAVRIPCCSVIDILMIYNSESRKSNLNFFIFVLHILRMWNKKLEVLSIISVKSATNAQNLKVQDNNPKNPKNWQLWKHRHVNFLTFRNLSTLQIFSPEKSNGTSRNHRSSRSNQYFPTLVTLVEGKPQELSDIGLQIE